MLAETCHGCTKLFKLLFTHISWCQSLPLPNLKFIWNKLENDITFLSLLALLKGLGILKNMLGFMFVFSLGFMRLQRVTSFPNI